MGMRAATLDLNDPVWMAWGAWLEHLQPSDGSPWCKPCVGAERIAEGCAKGQRLYRVFRAIRPGLGVAA